MASGFSPKLPLQQSDEDGQVLTKTAREAIMQNMKMLMLTVPGERVMDPTFGVGLRRWLFRPLTNATYEEIATEIRRQISTHLPFVNFKGIGIETAEEDVTLGDNGIRIKITYSVAAIGGIDELILIEKAGLF